MRWLAVIRDVTLISILTAIGGFLVAIFGVEVSSPDILLRCVSGILSIVGFTISGAIVKVDRFKHLSKVAIGLWIVSLVNVFFFEMTVLVWLVEIISIAIAMVIGGLLSYIFAKSPEENEMETVP